MELKLASRKRRKLITQEKGRKVMERRGASKGRVRGEHATRDLSSGHGPREMTPWDGAERDCLPSAALD